MAEESHAEPGGLFESLKNLSVSLVGIVQTRLELLSVDIAEERVHQTAQIVLALLALFCFGVGIVLLSILIVFAFWESHRLAALGGLAVIFLATGAGVVWFALHKARTKPKLFQASLAELAKDLQHLKARS